MSHFIITIDGPSASGKSTLAKKIAQRLGINYLDSGAFYRSIAAYLIEKDVALEDESFLTTFLDTAELKLVYEGSFARYYFNDLEVTPFLRKEPVAMKASFIAKQKAVRNFVNKNLQEISKKGDFIADGRDLGSKVFPFADVKFFLTATLESRAKRRELEQKTMGIETSFEKVLEQLKLRDEQDSKRKIDPLVRPEDAFFIDTTSFTSEEVCDEMLFEIKKKFSVQPSFFRTFICIFLKGYFSLFYRFQVFGEEYSRKFLGGLVYANHTSFYDGLLLLTLLGPNTVFIASQKVISKNFPIRLITSLFPLILVDEKKMPRDFFRSCNRAIHRGCPLVIFPEGARSTEGVISPFKEGISSIIVHCKVKEVLPIYIGGVYNIWPKGKSLPSFFKKITVLVSKPIQVSGHEEVETKNNRAFLTDQLRGRLKNLEKHFKDTYECRT
jgi:cytidylate kinase